MTDPSAAMPEDATAPPPAAAADPDYFEREYNARAAVPGSPALLAALPARAAAARAALARVDGVARARCTLAWGPGAKDTVDLFQPPAPGAPLLVFVHGGYWRSLDKDDFSWIAPPWVERGAAVALPNYDLLPQVPMERIVEQVRRAIAHLWLEAPALGIDRERIVVCGHSAGGHLAAMAACTDWPALDAALPPRVVSAALTVSGLHDLEPLRRTRFLAPDLGLDDAAARALSPAFLSPTPGVRVATCVGGDESGEFHRQARLLAQRWGAAVERDVPMPGRNHFTVIDALAEPGSALFDAAAALLGARGGMA